MRYLLAAFTCLLLSVTISAQQPAPSIIVLQADRVFDGERMQSGWAVVVRGERIDAAGPMASLTIPAGARTIVLKGMTLMPHDKPGFWENLGYHIYGDPWKEQRYSEE